jgi:ligand-binding sensor domain-containing protein
MKTVLRFLCSICCLIILMHPLHAQWVPGTEPSWGSINCLAGSGTGLFAGTSDGGFVHSIDGGNTWTASNAGLTNMHVNALAVSGARIFAGTNSGIFLSTDSGANWTAVAPAFATTRILSLILRRTDLIIGTDGGGVYSSASDSTNWTQIGLGLWNRSVRTLLETDSCLFAGTDEGIFRSTKNKTNWTQVNTGLTNMDILTLAVSGTNLLVGTNGGGVFRSGDNGAVWMQTGVTNTSVQTIFASGATAYAGTRSGELYRTADNGTNWALLSNNVASSDVRALGQSGKILVAGSSNSKISLSSNGGASWTAVYPYLTTATVGALAVAGTTEYAGVSGGGVFRSADNGAMWTKADFPNIDVIALAEYESMIVAGTRDRGVFRSTDGVHWISINTGLQDVHVASLAFMGSSIFAGTPSGVFTTNDGGNYWSSVGAGLTNSDVRSLVYSDTLMFAGTNGGGVFKFNYVRRTWTAVNTGLADLNVLSLTSSGKKLYAGTSRGVFLSTNNGASWIPVGTGLPDVPVAALVIFERNIFAGTANGVFVSTETDARWAAVNTGLPNASVNALAVSYTTLFVGTAGGGVWCRPLTEMITIHGPDGPELLFPAQDAVQIPSNNSFMWVPIPNGLSYELQISVDSTFASSFFDMKGITYFGFYVSGLAMEKTYYWRVMVTDLGGRSTWSDVHRFATIVPLPGRPAALSPADSAFELPLTPVLTWSAASRAASYELQVATDPNFSYSACVIAKSGITSTSFTVNGLNTHTRYYWRVNATNAAGTSAWSPMVSFTTFGIGGIPVPAAPTLRSPESGTAGQTGNIDFSWNASDGAATYLLQVSPNARFTPTVVNRQTIDSTSTIVTGLKNNTYYWRVAAVNDGGMSAWSAMRSFTVAHAPLPGVWRQPASGLANHWVPGLGASGTTLFAGGMEGVYRSVDNGASWIEASSLPFTTFVSFAASGPYLIAGTNRGVLRSADNGTSWTPIPINRTDSLIMRLIVSGSHLFAGLIEDGGIYRSDDNGNHWTPASAGLTEKNIYSLVASDGDLFAGTVDGLFHSTDDGAHWSPFTTGLTHSGPLLTVEALSVCDTNLFACTPDCGLFVSSTKHADWTSTGLTNTQVKSLAVSGTNIFAATQNGIFLSSNNGMTWNDVSDDSAMIDVYTLIVNGDNLFAGTANGIWRRSITETTTHAALTGTRIPSAFALAQNYPNPFNPTTTLSFSLPTRSFVTLKVYDALGREISVIVSEELPAGSHTRQWNAAGLPSGVYFYRLQAGTCSTSLKLMLLK